MLLSNEPRIRKCYESECEDCKDLSPRVASCSYGSRFVGQHATGPMAVSSGKVCHYNRLYEPKNPPVSSLAQSSPSSTEPEYSLAFQKELDHDDPPTLQERRSWKNAAEVRMREP